MDERIGVIGLGRMGRAISVRLAGQGCLRYRLDAERRRTALAPGIAAAGRLEDVVDASDILILSLFDDAAVRETLDRLARLDLSGRLVVETSTVSPAVVRAAAPAIEAAGGRLIDAPISGGPEMVAAGTIGLFVGGAAKMSPASRPSPRAFPPRLCRWAGSARAMPPRS
jgi:3-hydroxyisobutyrate dehydrogenase